MEHIWSPWRYGYISSGKAESGCVFCNAHRIPPDAKPDDWDRQRLVVHRGDRAFIILNLFPYTSGHLMIAPYDHVGSLIDLDEPSGNEIMALARRSLAALESEYRPDGFNVGFNFGSAAGAGIADHLHLHVVPRWSGDANFVSIIGETRVLPEELPATYDRLKKHF